MRPTNLINSQILPTGQQQGEARAYFDEHPEARDDVMRAWFAYHCEHFSEHPGAHNFTNMLRWCKCTWCGRSRTDVRWDGLPMSCQKRPVIGTPEGVIRKEEEKYFRLLKRAKTEVPKLIKKGVTPEQMHSTYGYTQDIVDEYE